MISRNCYTEQIFSSLVEFYIVEKFKHSPQ